MTNAGTRERLAARLRGFRPLGIVAILAIAAGQAVPPLGALLVLGWVKLSRTPWKISATRTCGVGLAD